MKVKDVLDYIRPGDKVKLIITEGSSDIIIYNEAYDTPHWATETLVSSIEIDVCDICIRSSMPYGYNLKLERQECEVSCCHD